MKTAVIYARYSSDSQSEQSIEGQLRVCEDYAKQNDILILGTYIDRAMTGTNDMRPDFQRMLWLTMSFLKKCEEDLQQEFLKLMEQTIREVRNYGVTTKTQIIHERCGNSA